MIYRVDYMLAVILAGAIAGAVFGRRTPHVEAARLARGYYILIAICVTLGAVVLAFGVVLANTQLWNRVGSGIGDVSRLFFGAMLGIALFRSRRLDLLREPAVYSALRLQVAFSFVFSGFVNALLYQQDMSEFFMQSGYSVTFLRFIMTVEVLCGAALLIPWAVLPAVFGLGVDMFGAIYTHIHNGDPLNDSTGAIGQLLRLGAIIAVWVLSTKSGVPAPRELRRKRLIVAAVGAVICISAAVVGGTMMRRPAVRPATIRLDSPTPQHKDATDSGVEVSALIDGL